MSREMSAQRVLLKLAGFSSAAKLEDDFGSVLVDVGHITELTEAHALVAPDDSDVQLHLSADYDWFERVIIESLRACGELAVIASRHETLS